MQPADWSDSTVVHMDRLRETCGRLGAAFPSDLTVGSSGAAAADLPARRDEIRGALPPEDRNAPDELIDGLAVSALAAMIVMAAERAGATVTAPPGETLHIRHPAGDLDPWALLGPMAAGEQEPSTWKEHPLVQALGDAPLRPASATVTTAPAR